jgi:UDP-glucuronate 4-epimerase
VFNIGHSTPVPLKEFISTMEQALGVKAVCEWLPAQPGDVPATHADTSALQAWVGYSPSTPLDEGVRRFTDWFRPRHRR